jgi:hypothetical protein
MDRKAREGINFLEAEIHYAADTEDEALLERLERELKRLLKVIDLRTGK